MEAQIHEIVNHKTAVKIVLSTYLGERCKYCDREYETLDDLQETVWAGYHEHGRLACKSCWNDKCSSERTNL